MKARLHRRGATLAILLFGNLIPLVPPRPAFGASQSFPAEADAMVKAGNPDTNFGGATSLQTNGTALAESYLRFTVSGLSGTVEQATLRVFAFTGAADGPEVFATATDWSETAVTFNSGRPARTSGSLGDAAAVPARTYVDFDVTAAVGGNGTFGFNLAPDSPDEVRFRSREGAAAGKRPLLMVITGPGPDVPPDTTIDSGPSGTWPTDLVSFAFSSTEAGSTFTCALNGSADAPCASPAAYSGLEEGPHIFEVSATGAGGLTDATPASRAFTIDTGGGGDPVLVGAGDIAGCSGSGDDATATLLDGMAGTVFTVGDNAYPSGTAVDYAACYDPTWGRHKARTRPAAGNHDYRTLGAAAYFAYFGPAAGDPTKGYYSYDLGAWHVVVLNSACIEVGGCDRGSPQHQWLRDDLAASAAACTVAYWHKPLFSSGAQHGGSTLVSPFWDVLYEHGAEVVVVGHEHLYERFAPQDPAGSADPGTGIRQFTVGTGGKSHYVFATPVANSEVRDDTSFGVLRLTLHPTGYDWEFVPVAGATFTDAGTGTCH